MNRQKIKRAKPAVEQALLYLRQAFSSNHWAMGERLPASTELARRAGVAFVTMLAALDILRGEGLLVSKPGKGTYVGSAFPVVPTPPKEQKPSVAQLLAAKLRIDILEEVFGAEAVLPSFKELGVRYRATYGSLKKATLLLIDQKLLVYEKRRLRYNRTLPHSRFSSVGFVVDYTRVKQGYHTYEGGWLEEFTRSLERECAGRNLRCVQHLFSGSNFVNPLFEQCHGFVIWLSGRIMVKHVVELVEKLQVFGKPVVVLNPVTIFRPVFEKLSRLRTAHPLFVSDITRDIEAGFAVGRFVLDKKYERICYFTSAPDDSWSQDRLEGLRRACTIRGLDPDRVVETFDAATDVSGFAIDKNDMAKIRMRCTDQIDKLKQGMALIEKTDFFLSKEDFTYREAIMALTLSQQFYPLFCKARRSDKKTVIVCCNDFMANEVLLSFAQAEAARTGEPLGLIGFDDLMSSVVNSITSYHFNFTETANRILRLIFHPQTGFAADRQTASNIFTIDGMVIDRGSV